MVPSCSTRNGLTSSRRASETCRPASEALVRLTYVTELSCSDRGLRFTIPTTVSPRYAPEPDRTGVGRPDADTLNPPRTWRVPYGLQLSVTLAMSGTISRIESPSHAISVALNGRNATVALSTRNTALDRDFVLAIETEGFDAPVAWVEWDDAGAAAIAVAFVPKLATASSPADITFVVDRSGSMEGSSIEEVRNAMQLCLRSMIPGCRFNIVSFGSTFLALFKESRPYDDASLAEASRHVVGLDANLGGTEILPALQFVLDRRGDRSLPRHIVVLTDGEVTNTDAVLALAKSKAADARIFTFGIGAGASHHLVNGLARAGGGAAEFIFAGERIEPKVVRQFGRLLSPALTNVRVDWGASDITPATSSMPPVFSGDRLLAYALANGVASSVIRLSADSPAGPLSLEAAIDSSHTTRGRAVGTLAARARIRELEESPEWLTSRGSRQTQRKASAVRHEIVSLAVKYGLVSRETSFVAVERRDVPVQGGMVLRRVPIAVTSGWGGVEFAFRNAMFGSAVPPTRSMDDTAAVLSITNAAPEIAQRLIVRDPPVRLESAARGQRQRPAPVSPMQALVALQRADGSWDLTRDLAEAIGCKLTGLEAALQGATDEEARRAWATALAIVWLEIRAQQSHDQWRLLVAKARNWLDRAHAQPPAGDSWLDSAEALLHEATA
jgi:hypothetical protein